MTWELPAADKTDGVAPTTATGGVLSYKWAAGAWGGSCCAAANDACAEDRCDATSGNLMVF